MGFNCGDWARLRVSPSGSDSESESGATDRDTVTRVTVTRPRTPWQTDSESGPADGSWPHGHESPAAQQALSEQQQPPPAALAALSLRTPGASLRPLHDWLASGQPEVVPARGPAAASDDGPCPARASGPGGPAARAGPLENFHYRATGNTDTARLMHLLGSTALDNSHDYVTETFTLRVPVCNQH